MFCVLLSFLNSSNLDVFHFCALLEFCTTVPKLYHITSSQASHCGCDVTHS